MADNEMKPRAKAGMGLAELFQARPWRVFYVLLGLSYVASWALLFFLTFWIGGFFCGATATLDNYDSDSCVSWYFGILTGISIFYAVLALGCFAAAWRRARLWVLLLLVLPELGSCVAAQVLTMH